MSLIVAATMMLTAPHATVASRSAPPVTASGNSLSCSICPDGHPRVSYLGCRPPAKSQKHPQKAPCREAPEELRPWFRFDLALPCVTACIILYLAGICAGIMPPMMIAPQHVKLVFPASLFYMHLALFGLGPWVGSVNQPPVETWSGPAICGVFTMLLMQGTVTILLCGMGPRSNLQHVLYPPTCIYMIAWTYYAYKSIGSPLYVDADAFQLGLYPLHMVMWVCSTSVQCILWTQIHHYQCGPGPMTAFPLPAKPILFAFVMLGCGLFGSLDYTNGDFASLVAPLGFEPPYERVLLPNLLFHGLSSACFYTVLSSAAAPLGLAASHYDKLSEQHTVGSKTWCSQRLLAKYFRGAHWYVWISWHGFPLAYAVGSTGVLGSAGRERLFVVCDLLAKFLPVSTYMALLATSG